MTATAAVAVALGAEFLVAGTQLFRSGNEPPQHVIDVMLAAAASALWC